MNGKKTTRTFYTQEFRKVNQGMCTVKHILKKNEINHMRINY